MTWLYQHDKVKAMISLTHGEGFGLPLFEAAYNGLPIIAPFWSGQTDFLTAKNKKGKLRPMISKVDYTIQAVPEGAVWDGVLQKDSMWCYPSETSYKTKIREFYENPQILESQARKLKKTVLRDFAEEKMLAHFCESFWLPQWGPMEGNAAAEDNVIEFR
jgi:glycosyltransferase involved in cell wall biosynthesis